jgi:hypothetical protein
MNKPVLRPGGLFVPLHATLRIGIVNARSPPALIGSAKFVVVRTAYGNSDCDS